MKLKTKIEVTYQLPVKGSKTGIIEANLFSCNQLLRNDFNCSYNYSYTNSTDNSSVQQDVINFTKEEIAGLYEIVKGEIPTGLSYPDMTTYLYYLGMKIKMAERFEIEESDIDIIID